MSIMKTAAELNIRLTPGVIAPEWTQGRVNEFHGGPETLLRWLETQSGLPSPPVRTADRITEYASALDTVTDSVISTSMQSDRWATASDLLARRDELLLGGWDETASETLPVLVQDLARAATGRGLVCSCEATRLLRVLEALQSGQTLPPHRCVLHDAPDLWPPLWRRILAVLTVIDPPAPSPHAVSGTALHAAQALILAGTSTHIRQDATFRHVHTRSDTAAIDFTAALLASSPQQLPGTVICCEDDSLALRLDASLSRLGLPTTGASAWSHTHPVLQILPLSLGLCRDPVEPEILLSFLTLPLSPLPRDVASKLTDALTCEPGLGSSEWERTVDRLCDSSRDPDGSLRERLDTWLLCDRFPAGVGLPVSLVRTRCTLVAQWASARASAISKAETSSPALIDALQIAASQAALFAHLAESQDTALTEPQLSRLLEESFARGVSTHPCPESEGGPIRVHSLSEIHGDCDRLIWLGLSTTDAIRCRWSAHQVRELQLAGIEIDDGSRQLSCLRSAEARGYSFVKKSFLAVGLPQDYQQRWHPLWLAICQLLPDDDIAHPHVLEDLIAAGNTEPLAPFTFDWQDSDLQLPQPSRPLWDIPAELLRDRQTVSATSLQDRLACPLKWTLTYQAQLRPGRIAELPGDFQLKGTFCHSILERVFGDGGPLPAVESAVAAVATAFDERLPLDAAPLAAPDKYFERQRLRSELENATRVLVETLAAGGYRIAGVEVELNGEAFGKSLRGWIDCLATRDDGAEAVIDFKYGGRSKYLSLIEDGQAVQLATYACGRATHTGRFPAVAYLVLADGLLYTPSESPVCGAPQRAVIPAPSIQTVWNRFADAIDRADGWLTSDEPVPARPLQDPARWPDGATLVLDPTLKPDNLQAVCRYCSFPDICGLREIT